MKTNYIKKILGLSIFLIGSMAFSQDAVKNNKLAFNSFSVTPLEVYFTDYSGGVAITGELGYKIGRNILTLSGSYGEEFVIWGNPDTFQQLNILYGREFEILNHFFIDTHGGLGMFRFKDEDYTKISVGIPLVCKMRYKTGDKFSIGLKFQVNVNSVKNIYSAGILLQWNY